MIVPGYVLGKTSTVDQPFGCTPKAGIFMCFSAALGAWEYAGDAGASPNGGGVSSVSVGFVDQAGNKQVAVCGAVNDGFDYNTGESKVFAQISEYSQGFGYNPLPVASLNGVSGGWQMSAGTVGSNWAVHYAALFGNTMQASVGTFVLPASGAKVTVTAPGFTPDLVIVAGGQGTYGGLMNVGALDALGNQWSVAQIIRYLTGSNPDRQLYRQKSGSLLQCPAMDSFTGSDADFTATGAIVANGFEITQTTPPATNITYAYMAIKDPNGGFRVGFNSFGASVAGLGWAPEEVLMCSSFATDAAANQGGIGAFMLGSASASLQAAESGGGYTRNHQLGADAGRGARWRFSNGPNDKHMYRHDSTGAVIDKVSVALAADGFSTGIVTGAAYNFGWIAMRGSEQSGCPWAFTPQIYRRR